MPVLPVITKPLLPTPHVVVVPNAVENCANELDCVYIKGYSAEREEVPNVDEPPPDEEIVIGEAPIAINEVHVVLPEQVTDVVAVV
jgi:hypothetical protein